MRPLGADSDPGGIRTHDSLIKSEVLYQLSYEILPFLEFLIELKDSTTYKLIVMKSVKETSYLRPRIHVRLNYTKYFICNLSICHVTTLYGFFYCFE